MQHHFALLILAMFTAVVLGCGAQPSSESTVGSAATRETHQAGNGPRLSRTDLTTAVNMQTLVATAPIATEFMQDTPIIYFIGTLENLPQDANIEIRWLMRTDIEPLTVSRTVGSGTHTFISHCRPPGDRFTGGEYWALVFVNGEEIGHAPFRIADRRSGGRLRVKELAVATSLEVQTKKVINPKTSFRRGTKNIMASFFVSGLEIGATIRALWYRDDQLIEENDIESQGEQRYAVSLESKKGLRKGDYAIEVEIDGEVMAHRSFHIGGEAVAPEVDRALLGTKLGKNHLPQHPKSVFPSKTKTLACGIRFVNLPEDAHVQVKWIAIKEGGIDLLETSESRVPEGGNASLGLTWQPGSKLASGPHAAVIFLNDRKMAELPFTVK
ncbi:MAG: hypothetical protein QNJ97_04855 [Myxococcota bacterium]|nr:hypothetical protein [Myxococcota bacterium]